MADDREIAERLRQNLSAEQSLADMVAAGIPPTRENLIDWMMNGETEKWGADHEAELPEHLQDWDALRDGPYNHAQ
jgi:hypothetical protein